MYSFLPLIHSIQLHEALSGILGSTSLAAWIFLLVPQFIENIQRGKADAISLPFLVVWIIGDITNLIGAFWASLIPTTIVLGLYFCFCDLALISQCLYYNNINATRNSEHRAAALRALADGDIDRPLLERQSVDYGCHSSDVPSSVRLGRRPRLSQNHSSVRHEEKTSGKHGWRTIILSILLVFIAGASAWLVALKSGAWLPTPDPVDGDGNENPPKGAMLLGGFSALCYLCARIPQIIKNYQRGTCEGVSILFFILALIGNATYGASILLHSTSHAYIMTNLPWLFGSVGTILQDIVIFIQFYFYSRNLELEHSSQVC